MNPDVAPPTTQPGKFRNVREAYYTAKQLPELEPSTRPRIGLCPGFGVGREGLSPRAARHVNRLVPILVLAVSGLS